MVNGELSINGCPDYHACSIRYHHGSHSLTQWLCRAKIFKLDNGYKKCVTVVLSYESRLGYLGLLVDE
jgi:hypothetical protein